MLNSRKNLACAIIKRKEKKMQVSINKAKTAGIIAVILMMASLMLTGMPVQPAKAQESASQVNLPHGGTANAGVGGVPILGPLPVGVTPAYTFVSKAYLSVSPNPIGVGQTLLVNIWTSPGMYHAFYMQGYTVYIKKPDGTQDTVGPMNSYMGDASDWFQYVVDQVGTWQFKFESPGTYIPAGSYVDSPTGQAFMSLPLGVNYTLGASVYYTPDSTGWQNVTVQQEMVSSWPPSPLPTDYWIRPAYPSNREWWPILGNYPFTGAYYYPNGRVLYSSNYKYTAYVQAPNTAHIVWRRQGNIAGLIGGTAGIYSISAGSGTPTIIYAGRCYQTLNKIMDGKSQNIWECYDLRTGQVYWDILAPTTTVMSMFGPMTAVLAPSFISYEAGTSEPVPGAEASNGYSVNLVAVSGGRLLKYNAWTGSVSVKVSLPSAISSATVSNAPWVWTVQSIRVNATTTVYRLINWTVAGSSSNFTSRIGTNITWPMSSLGSTDLDAGVAVYCWWATPPGPQWCIGHFLEAADLHTGALLWINTNNDTLAENVQGAGFVAVDRGKVAFGAHGRHWACWDARTGKKLWESDQTAYPWGAWFPYSTASYDFNETNGAIITSTYEGVYAIDWNTGHILWHFTDPEVPFEDPYSAGPFFTAVESADGKIYAFNGEHTPSEPLTRGWKTFCLNATTGELIWSMTGPMTPGAVADGYLTASNSYDGYMYVFGKGRSATTVSASPKTIANGAEVLIEGTVLDQSPGDQGSVQNPTQRLDAQQTVPCVSAASMETQMEYLYEQYPIDGIWHNETITGVPVILTAIGSDNTVIDLGTTTTNGYYGTFSFAWTPPKADTYTITATFAGDGSYGSSTAATAVLVSPAPSATPTPTATPPATQPDNTGLLYAIMAAVIVAIIIGVAAIVVSLRKR
jgi:outer membrane protein assembly factor BamB